MLKVAKVLFKNPEGKYLVLFRNNHPIFGNAMDLPGGTLEKGETLEEAAIREVYEESGIRLNHDQLRLIEKTRRYSRVGTQFALYAVLAKDSPEVTLSWEHADYKWVTKEDLLQGAKDTRDHFLQMTVDNIEKV